MTPTQRRERLRMQLVAAAAAAGDVPIEVTAVGIRLRDDVPIGLDLTPLADLMLCDPDAPIPLVAL